MKNRRVCDLCLLERLSSELGLETGAEVLSVTNMVKLHHLLHVLHGLCDLWGAETPGSAAWLERITAQIGPISINAMLSSYISHLKMCGYIFEISTYCTALLFCQLPGVDLPKEPQLGHSYRSGPSCRGHCEEYSRVESSSDSQTRWVLVLETVSNGITWNQRWAHHTHTLWWASGLCL